MSNLVGTGLNQVPTNGMLGGLAYQDPNHASIKNLDLKNLSQINSEIADTAVDVFVYDTRKDSDGGAWRKRTQHTSWYNETLGTATRGTRREFPAVAVIVAESSRVTIYDGDDPDLPMWMVFTQATTGTSVATHLAFNAAIGSIFIVNGILCVGFDTGNGWGISVINFVSDSQQFRWTGGIYILPSANNIVKRNVISSWVVYDTTTANIGYGNAQVKDVAMTVLPNAPIDDATGLPIPTIVIGTVGGTSVITEDNTIVDYTGFNPSEKVAVDSKYVYSATRSGTNDYIYKSPFLSADADYDTNTTAGSGGWYANSANNGSETPTLKNMTITDLVITKDSSVIRSGTDGIEVFDSNVITIDDNESEIPIAYITSDYNTGYQYGRIEGTFLSDTDVEDDVELVSNGTFDTDITGWTVVGAGAPSAIFSSGQAQLTNGDTNSSSLDQTITTVIGKHYTVSATITPQGGGPLPRLYANGEFVAVPSTANTAQTVTFTYLARTTSTTISVNSNTNVPNAVTLADNISAKLTNNVYGNQLVTNGTFSTNVDGWTAGDSNTILSRDPSTGGGRLKVAGGGSGGSFARAIQTFKTAVGKTYIVSFHWWRNATDGRVMVRNDTTNSGGGSVFYQDISSSNLSYQFRFTATAATSYLFLYTMSVSDFSYYDDVSIRLEEPDRSVHHDPGADHFLGLQVNGTITKSPVATGADLVAYSGFSEDTNYLEKITTDVVNFGTSGIISFMGWMKQSVTGQYSYIVSVKDPATANPVGMAVHSTSGFFYVYEAAAVKESTTFVADGNWHHCVGIVNGTSVIGYVDGKEVINTTGTAPNLANVNKFAVGHFANSSRVYPHLGSLALLRVSRSIPSAAQVKKIYEDEKHLFLENAKATLYGSSNAVTALAFDDTTNTLHVGTSAGRSEFQGLRRINNTTTAVTTAISASNGLVTEQ